VTSRRYQTSMLVIIGIGLGASLIHPPFPREQFLQHGPTALALPILFFIAWRGWLSSLSMTGIGLFTMLHVIGARYMYSFVPYDRVLEQVLNFNITEAFGFERNHYDRMVHFMFGLLITVPMVEMLRCRGTSILWTVVFAFAGSMAISGLYEIFEWLLTVIVASESADRYNGQQGDLWDAQKDMALAAIGAILSATAAAFWFRAGSLKADA
jgi:putative membrane protein